MTTLTFSGTNTSFIVDAFFDSAGDQNIDLVSGSSTEVVVVNPETGHVTTFTGFGFQVSGPPGDEVPVAGTITGISVTDGGSALQGTLTGISWGLVALSQALDAASVDNLQPMANLFNSSGPITLNAAGAGAGLDMYDLLDPELTSLITQPMTILGTGFTDIVFGGTGNDSIIVGADNGGFHGGYISATPGNDTIDFSGVSSSTFQWIDFKTVANGSVSFNIDAVANTGSVRGAGFTTTLLDVQRVMAADGLGLEGGDANDVFNIANADNTWFMLRGNEGNDTFNIHMGDGGGRLSYTFGSNGTPTSGINANLATGIITDGLGGTDTLNFLSGTGRLEIQGTNNNDTMVGSSRNDTFITQQGNDTVDGGGGFDLVRYDRNGVDAVNVNLNAGTASGVWDGLFFTDRLTSIENIRGSRQGDDTIVGTGAHEQFEGRGGNDSLVGNGGNDDLRGEDGNDTLRGGAGLDTLRGGDGNDLLDASGGSTGTQGFGDYIRAGLGQDTIIGHAGLWAAYNGIDISYSDVGGVGGLTIVSGVNGTGTVVSGDGRVNDTFTFVEYFQGSQDNDNISGGADDRWEGFEGNAGDDTIDGGGGDAQVGYNNEHYEGGSAGITAHLGMGDLNGATGTVTDTFGDTDTLVRINQIRGSVFDDLLDGSGRTDDIRLRGEDGNDTLRGGEGENRMEGGSGNDLFVVNANSSGDVIGVGLGNDTVDMTNAGAWVDVSTWESGGSKTFTINAQTNTGTINNGTNGTTTLLGVAHVMTNPEGGLSFNGNSADDTFFISQIDGGWISLQGRGGDDTFRLGGSTGGTVRLDYRDYEGNSTGIMANLAGIGSVSDGFGGNDTIFGQNQTEIELRGSMATDTITGSGRDERFILMGGDDTLDAGGGFDLLRYDRSGVQSGVNVNLATGTATGTWSADGSTSNFTHRISGVEAVRGSRNDNDTLTGSAGNEWFGGRGGNDSILGAGGNDTLEGEDGNDTMRGGDGDDILRDGSGDDIMYGGKGNDVWEAAGGHDTFYGNNGFDTIRLDVTSLAPQSFVVETNLATGDSGAMGNPNLRDTLISVEAIELIGDFDINATGSDAANRIETDLGSDTLTGGLGNDTLLAGAGNDTLTGNQGRDVLNGENGNDRIDGGLDNDSATGGNGNDLILGGAGFDTLRGGEGNDTVNGGNGRDLAYLGGGDDLFVDNGQGGVNGRDTVFANAGNDTVGGGNGNDVFHGQDGSDRLLGRLGNDRLFGGNQNDTMEGGDGADTVAGGNGRDRAFLGNGNDRWFDNDQSQFGGDFVQGGNGNDWIQAGGGDDTLAGGAGADTFVLLSAIDDDVITDYTVGTDDLDITTSLWNGALTQGRLDALTNVAGGNLVFTFDNGDTLTLNGVTSTAGLLGDIDLI